MWTKTFYEKPCVIWKVKEERNCSASVPTKVSNSSDSMATNIIHPKDLVEEGDTVIVYINFNQSTVLVVERGKTLQTKYGALRHDFLIGKKFGSRISCTKGYVYILCPSPELWSQNLEHRTQILYTSDVALVTLNLELKPGSLVGEAGTGSGSLSHALIRTIAPTGHLHTFEVNEERYEAAKTEFTRHGLSSLVTINLRDVCKDGFPEDLASKLDAVFLDLPQPWDALESAKRALKTDRPTRFCSFSPCIEQVQRMCDELRKLGFVDLETIECVPRTYKVLAVDRNTGAVKPQVKPKVAMEAEAKRRGPKEPRLDPEVQEVPTEKGSDEMLIHAPFPFQQPTHTGYLTFATLPPRLA